MRPTWQCDCESGVCEDSHKHRAGSCQNTGANVVLVFGMKQNLCDECLEVAKSNFPNDIEEL